MVLPSGVNQIVSGAEECSAAACPPPPPPVEPSRWEAHPWPLSGRFLLVAFLLMLGPYIAINVGVVQTAQSILRAAQSITISWSPRVMRSLLMLSTTITTAQWTLIEADFRLVEPWRQLNLPRSTDRVARTEAVIVDWERMDPISSLWIGLSRGRASLASWVSLGSLLSQVTSVLSSTF